MKTEKLKYLEYLDNKGISDEISIDLLEATIEYIKQCKDEKKAGIHGVNTNGFKVGDKPYLDIENRDTETPDITVLDYLTMLRVTTNSEYKQSFEKGSYHPNEVSVNEAKQNLR